MVGVALGGLKQSGKGKVDLVEHFPPNPVFALGFHTEWPGFLSQQSECLNSDLALLVEHQ